MSDPFNPAAGHLFYMADPSNLADHFFYPHLGLVNADPHPPPPFTNANGAPGADADDEGPNASDRQEEYTPWAAPSVPAVGRRGDDYELERRKEHTAPARSRRNWFSSAALMIARSAASASTDRERGHTTTSTRGTAERPLYPPQPQSSYPANPYDRVPVTPDPHSSCPLCGTPYQRGPSGWGPPRAPAPRDVYGQEQRRDGPHLGRCPACHCPTRTQLSPTGAPTRFLSSGRREYVTGYPSPSQQHPRGVTTTTYTNTNNTSRPYGSPAGFYGGVAATGASSRGYQAESRTRETQRPPAPRVTCTETRNYASGMYGGSRSPPLTECPPAANRESYHDRVALPSISNGGPAPAASTTPPVASSSAKINTSRPHEASGSFYGGVTTTGTSGQGYQAENDVTSQEGQADRTDAAYSGSTNEALVSDMVARGFIKSDAVADVMRAVDRAHYVTDKAEAYSSVTYLSEQGVAVPAPHILAAILESVLPYIKADSHVLDIGASTGLFAAMLYHRTGKDGVTVSLPPSDKVVELVKNNLVADGLDQPLQEGRILLVKGDETSGYAPCAPYNVIYVTKVMEEIPPLLLTQLASPGRMVILVRTDGRDATIQVDKDAAGGVSQKELSVIVPPLLTFG